MPEATASSPSMETKQNKTALPPHSAPTNAGRSQGLAHRLLTIGENRLELLAVEMQEERERLQRALFLGVGVAICTLLACITLTAAVVIWLVVGEGWPPLNVLALLTAIYGIAGICLYESQNAMMRNAKPFAASIGQLRKDSACCRKIFQ